MKTPLLILAGASVLVLCIFVYQFKSHYDDDAFLSPFDSSQGLGSSTSDLEYHELRQKFNDKIIYYQNEATVAYRRWLWVSLSVTVLTASSAFILAVTALKKGNSIKRKSVILTSAFTFLAALGNWGVAQLSEAQNKAIKNSQEVGTMRSEFFNLYKQSAGDTTDQSELIVRYTDELREH